MKRENQVPMTADNTDNIGKIEEKFKGADSSGIKSDIGKWLYHLTKAEVEYWIHKGSKDFQNCDAKLIEPKSYLQKRKICVPSARSACLNDACKVGGPSIVYNCVFLQVKKVFTATSANSWQLRDSQSPTADSLTGTMLRFTIFL